MPLSPSAGMPGGSWVLEEEEEQRLERQDLVNLHTSKDGQKPLEVMEPSDSTASLPAWDSTPHSPESQESYQIVVLDPAELSEEISLLASPAASSTSRETWRVRISPEYDIEVLPTDPRRERKAAGRHIRDSPEQRRSRFLDNIFPEIKDDIHSASRCPTDTKSVAPTLDVDWDFAQEGPLISGSDASAASDDDLYAPAGTSENPSGLGLTFPTSSSVDGLVHDEAEHPGYLSHSPSTDDDADDLPISAPNANAPSNDEDPRSGAEHSETLPALGLAFPSTSSLVNDLSNGAERALPPSPSSVKLSFDGVGHPISEPDPGASTSGANVRTDAENSEDSPALGLNFTTTPSADDLSQDEAEHASLSSPSAVKLSFDGVGHPSSEPDPGASTNGANVHTDAEDSEDPPALGLTFPTTTSSADDLSHDEAEHASLSSPSSVKLSLDGVGHPISEPDASVLSNDANVHRGAGSSETLPALGLNFPTSSSADDLSQDEAERPCSPSPSSVKLSGVGHPISEPDPGASTNGANVHRGAGSSEDPPVLGVPFLSTSSADDLSQDEAECPSPSSPSSVGSSLKDVDLASPSPPVTSISMPSTARPLSSASNSTLRTDTPSSGFADSDVEDLDSLQVEASGAADRSTETPSSVMHERPGDEHAPDDAYVHPHSDSTFHRLDSNAGDPFLRPQCTLFDPAGVTDGNDSESLPSLLIRPATASALSDDEDGRDEHLEADTEGQSDRELEYLDEYQYPALTPLSITGLDEISLPLSLDSSFEFPEDWVEVVPFYRSQDARLGDEAVVSSSNLPSATLESGDVHGGADFAEGAEALEAVQISSDGSQTSLAEAVTDLPHTQGGRLSAMEDGTHIVDDCELSPASLSLASADSFVVEAQAPFEAPRPDEEEPSLVVPAVVLCASKITDPQVAGDDEDKQTSLSSQSPPAFADHRFEDEFHGIPELPALQFHLTSFPGADDVLAGGKAPLDAPQLEQFTSASVVVPRTSESTALKNGVETPTGERYRRPYSASVSTDDEALCTPPTPALPALHFPSPSLTDEVLSSPIFRLLDFVTVESGSSVAAARTTARHARALTTSHVERRSILWAPHDVRELRDGRHTSVHAGAKDKGKARARARTLSFADDSRSRHGGEQRVEREVQTDVLIARDDDVKRLKQRLRVERAKTAGLVRERDKSAGYERWEASWARKWQYFGGFSYDFEDGLM